MSDQSEQTDQTTELRRLTAALEASETQVASLKKAAAEASATTTSRSKSTACYFCEAEPVEFKSGTKTGGGTCSLCKKFFCTVCVKCDAHKRTCKSHKVADVISPIQDMLLRFPGQLNPLTVIVKEAPGVFSSVDPVVQDWNSNRHPEILRKSGKQCFDRGDVKGAVGYFRKLCKGPLPHDDDSTVRDLMVSETASEAELDRLAMFNTDVIGNLVVGNVVRYAASQHVLKHDGCQVVHVLRVTYKRPEAKGRSLTLDGTVLSNTTQCTAFAVLRDPDGPREHVTDKTVIVSDMLKLNRKKHRLFVVDVSVAQFGADLAGDVIVEVSPRKWGLVTPISHIANPRFVHPNNSLQPQLMLFLESSPMSLARRSMTLLMAVEILHAFTAGSIMVDTRGDGPLQPKMMACLSSGKK
jgi:hypothetical protein